MKPLSGLATAEITIKKGLLLWEEVAPEAVGVGDLVVYRPMMENGRLVIHRVIRRLRIGGKLAFLTKGDRRWMFDPLVLPEWIVGRVAGKRNRWLAGVSCLQAVLFIV